MWGEPREREHASAGSGQNPLENTWRETGKEGRREEGGREGGKEGGRREGYSYKADILPLHAIVPVIA